jgi:hypothetical protein
VAVASIRAPALGDEVCPAGWAIAGWLAAVTV